METSKFCVVIKYYFLCKKTPAKVKAKLNKHFSISASLIRMIYKWCADFRYGRYSMDDAKRSGRPKEATIKEMIEKVNVAIMQDRQVKVCELAKMCKISKERIGHILHDEFHMRKLSEKNEGFKKTEHPCTTKTHGQSNTNNSRTQRAYYIGNIHFVKNYTIHLQIGKMCIRDRL